MKAIVIACVAALLAGCSDGAQQAPEDPDVPSADHVNKGKGVIRGVVIDASIRPVVGATVAVNEETRATDENGGFLFVNVEPGTYFLHVSKPGWNSVQQSVQVVADIKSPPVVRVQLEAIPGSEPRADTMSLAGFVSCSIGLPIIYTSCAVDEETTRLLFHFSGNPDWIQTEVLWDSTQPSGTSMYLIQALCATDDCPGAEGDSLSGFPDRFDEGGRESPAVVRIGQDFIATRELGGEGVVAIDASADGPVLATGAALEQDFTAYVTFFYNIDPDDGWRFTEDGAYL